MVSLICNKNIIASKTKQTVSEDASTVKEIVDFGDDGGAGEAEADVEGVSTKRAPDRRTIAIVYIAKGSVEGWGREAGMGADGDGRDVEEPSLEGIGG
jgi:hypothetical protein